jgi:hypothetical protein
LNRIVDQWHEAKYDEEAKEADKENPDDDEGYEISFDDGA